MDLPLVDHSSKDAIELIGMDASEMDLGLWIPLIWRENHDTFFPRNMSILCLQNQSCEPLKSMNATSAKHCIYKRIFLPYSEFHKDICGSGFSMPGGNANFFWRLFILYDGYQMIRMIWSIWYEIWFMI